MHTLNFSFIPLQLVHPTLQLTRQLLLVNLITSVLITPVHPLQSISGTRMVTLFFPTAQVSVENLAEMRREGEGVGEMGAMRLMKITDKTYKIPQLQ